MRTPFLPLLTLSVVCPLYLLAEEPDFKREGDAEKRALKDPLEGKPPPELQVTSWLNSDGKALTLKELRGKVIVLDFWGVW